MTWIGLGVFWFGYSLVAYGWSQLQGSNVGLTALMWPGKYNGATNPDSGGAAATSGTSQGYATTPTHNPVPTTPKKGAPKSSPRNDGKPCGTITSIAQAKAILATPGYSTACRQSAADYLYTSALGNG